ncbi:MAG: GNAT family N-acetyltransferase [Burkholderiaceae bacterium]|nr:GNAT family N-acetyltransferase [Burkholderiaceae bacterium]
MHIEPDDLSRAAVLALLREHLDDMYAWSPAESVHALDLSGLRATDVTVWTAWRAGELLACGALKELSADHGEIKSMRTPRALRRRGAGRAMLAHILQQARQRGYRQLSLETGAEEPFRPAQALYRSVGFSYCPPFGSYQPDPNSVFMTLKLEQQGP